MINLNGRSERNLISILLIGPKGLELEYNLTRERRREVYLEGPNTRPCTFKAPRNIISGVIVLEDHLSPEVDRLATLLLDEGFELFAFGFGAGLQRFAFALRSVVELVVDVEGGHRQDLEQGFPVVWDGLEIAVRLAE